MRLAIKFAFFFALDFGCFHNILQSSFSFHREIRNTNSKQIQPSHMFTIVVTPFVSKPFKLVTPGGMKNHSQAIVCVD